MKSRRKFGSAFKAKVTLESLREQSSLSELSEKYDLEISRISKWKREFIEKSSLVFDLETPKKTTEGEGNLSIMNAIDKIHTEYPFYGFRRIRKELETYGFLSAKNW
jgi:transposase